MRQKVFAGIDIGATNIKYGLVGPDGTVKVRRQIPTPQNALADTIFGKVRHCGEQLLVEADDLGMTVDRIGVGSPGCINIETGVVEGTCPNIPGWVGFHLRDRLRESLNLLVLIDNDANCAAIAEHRFGAGKGYSNLICLTIGTGIGGGLILNGEIYHGTTFSAGEIGHMRVRAGDGSANVYHLESLVSSRAILNQIRERLAGSITPAFEALIGENLDGLTIRRVFTAMKRGDQVATDVINRAAETLGIALAGLVNVINPQRVILGGGIAEGESRFVDKVKDTVLAEALPSAVEGLTIVAAQLGNAAGFIGAAILGETGDGENEVSPAES